MNNKVYIVITMKDGKEYKACVTGMGDFRELANNIFNGTHATFDNFAIAVSQIAHIKEVAQTNDR